MLFYISSRCLSKQRLRKAQTLLKSVVFHDRSSSFPSGCILALRGDHTQIATLKRQPRSLGRLRLRSGTKLADPKRDDHCDPGNQSLETNQYWGKSENKKGGPAHAGAAFYWAAMMLLSSSSQLRGA